MKEAEISLTRTDRDSARRSRTAPWKTVGPAPAVRTHRPHGSRRMRLPEMCATWSLYTAQACLTVLCRKLSGQEWIIVNSKLPYLSCASMYTPICGSKAEVIGLDGRVAVVAVVALRISRSYMQWLGKVTLDVFR